MVFKSYEEMQEYAEAKKREEDRRFLLRAKESHDERKQAIQKAGEKGIRAATPRTERIKTGLRTSGKGLASAVQRGAKLLEPFAEHYKMIPVKAKKTKEPKYIIRKGKAYKVAKGKDKEPTKKRKKEVMTFFKDW